MKRFWMMLLCLALVLSLAACGTAPAETEAPAETAAPAETTEAPEAPAEAIGTDGASATDAGEEEGVSATDAAEEPAVEDLPDLPEIEAEWTFNEEQYNAAQEYVGRDVAELYDAIGMPPGGSQYAASCLEENAEDGMLYYDGFYVWTVRSDSGEVVHEVYLSE